jgi:hypothetical protein
MRPGKAMQSRARAVPAKKKRPHELPRDGRFF